MRRASAGARCSGRRPSRLAFLCGGLALAALWAQPASADDPPAQCPAVTPLASNNSGLTRDAGNVAIIEHDGSPYDREDSSFARRAAVAQR